MGRFAAFWFTSVVLCAAAQADVQWPKDWAIKTDAGGTIAVSPPAADGSSVSLLAPPLETSDLPMAKWVDAKVREAADGGQVFRRVGVRPSRTIPEAPVLYSDALILRPQGGTASVRMYFYAYEIAGGRQYALIVSPSKVTKSDPRIIMAQDTIAGGWKARVALSRASGAAAKPAAPVKIKVPELRRRRFSP